MTKLYHLLLSENLFSFNFTATYKQKVSQKNNMSSANTTIFFIHLTIMKFFDQYDNHQAVYKNKKENAHSYE